MKKLFMFSKDNFNALLQILPEFHGLTYCSFSDITPLIQVIKQNKPHAFLVDFSNYKELITIGKDVIDEHIPIIVFGNSTSAPLSNHLQIHHLPETSHKQEVIKLFSNLGLINGHVDLGKNGLVEDPNSNGFNRNGLENQPYLEF